MTVLGFLCGDYITSIYASDIAGDIIAMAKENLDLLSIQGLDRRKTHLEEMYRAFNKESHLNAIQSAERLSQRISSQSAPITHSVFFTDIMDAESLGQEKFIADVVFTDVPYGNLTNWSAGSLSAIDQLLDTIRKVIGVHSIVAISSDKSQRITNPNYKRIRKMLVGKRKIEFLQKVN